MLHELRLVHRDISADNIFYLEDGAVKLGNLEYIKKASEVDHHNFIPVR